MTQMNIPRVKEFGVPSTGGNTCVANFVHTTIFPNGPKDFEDKVEPGTARALDAFIEGMTLHFVTDRKPLSREEILRMVERIAG